MSSGFRGGRGGYGRGRGRGYGSAPPPERQYTPEEIQDAVKSEDVTWNDVKRYSDIRNGSPSLFSLNRLILSTASKEGFVSVALNASRFFSLEPMSSVRPIFDVLLTFLPSQQRLDKEEETLVEIEIDHYMAGDAWLPSLLDFCSELRVPFAILVVDSLIEDSILRCVLKLPAQRISFERSSLTGNEFMKNIVPCCSSLNFFHCDNRLLVAALDRSCASLSNLSEMNIIAEENSIRHSLWARLLYTLRRLPKRANLSIELTHDADRITCFVRALWRSGRCSDDEFDAIDGQIKDEKKNHERFLSEAISVPHTVAGSIAGDTETSFDDVDEMMTSEGKGFGRKDSPYDDDAFFECVAELSPALSSTEAVYFHNMVIHHEPCRLTLVYRSHKFPSISLTNVPTVCGSEMFKTKKNVSGRSVASSSSSNGWISLRKSRTDSNSILVGGGTVRTENCVPLSTVAA